MIALSGLLHPYERVSNNLSVGVVTMFFVINLAAVGALVFMMISYFVRQKNAFQ